MDENKDPFVQSGLYRVNKKTCGIQRRTKKSSDANPVYHYVSRAGYKRIMEKGALENADQELKNVRTAAVQCYQRTYSGRMKRLTWQEINGGSRKRQNRQAEEKKQENEAKNEAKNDAEAKNEALKKRCSGTCFSVKIDRALENLSKHWLKRRVNVDRVYQLLVKFETLAREIGGCQCDRNLSEAGRRKIREALRKLTIAFKRDSVWKIFEGEL